MGCGGLNRHVGRWDGLVGDDRSTRDLDSMTTMRRRRVRYANRSYQAAQSSQRSGTWCTQSLRQTALTLEGYAIERWQTQ